MRIQFQESSLHSIMSQFCFLLQLGPQHHQAELLRYLRRFQRCLVTEEQMKPSQIRCVARGRRLIGSRPDKGRDRRRGLGEPIWAGHVCRSTCYARVWPWWYLSGVSYSWCSVAAFDTQSLTVGPLVCACIQTSDAFHSIVCDKYRRDVVSLLFLSRKSKSVFLGRFLCGPVFPASFLSCFIMSVLPEWPGSADRGLPWKRHPAV